MTTIREFLDLPPEKLDILLELDFTANHLDVSTCLFSLPEEEFSLFCDRLTKCINLFKLSLRHQHVNLNSHKLKMLFNAIKCLCRLISLDLSELNIGGTICAEKTYKSSYTRVQIVCSIFKNLPFLKELYLKHNSLYALENPITKEDCASDLFDSISNCKNLENLDICNTYTLNRYFPMSEAVFLSIFKLLIKCNRLKELSHRNGMDTTFTEKQLQLLQSSAITDERMQAYKKQAKTVLLCFRKSKVKEIKSSILPHDLEQEVLTYLPKPVAFKIN